MSGLKELQAEAAAIIGRAKAEHEPVRTFLLFSGGNDSLLLLDAVHDHADEVVHINTGIGVPATNEFARTVGASYGLPFSEYHPPVSYDELVLGRWDGLPGPGAHRFTYTMLKERCIEQLLRDHRTKRGQRFLLLTGARLAESSRRMGYADEWRRKGGQVWVNPLLRWTNDDMRLYRGTHDLPVNEVAANLHMSGECLCGAMADQGPDRAERAQLAFFYPEVNARLTALEERCRQAGKTYCEWGVKRSRVIKEQDRAATYSDVIESGELVEEPEGPGVGPVNELCQSCEFRAGER